jgi:hypothetical protein
MHRFESPKSAIARTFDHASGTSRPVVAAAADGSPTRRRQRRAQPHLLDSERFVVEFTREVRTQKRRRAEQRRVGVAAHRIQQQEREDELEDSSCSNPIGATSY